MHREQVGVRFALALGAALFFGNLGSKGCEPEKPSAGAPSEGGSAHAANPGGRPEDSANGGKSVTPGTCGTRGGVVCAKDEFCNHEPDVECGATDRGGKCAKLPEACIDLYKPVCGCDDKTYGNSCNAHAASVSVKAEGECKAAPVPASGADSAACKIVKTEPFACTKEYKPVCGCDHRTYGNACEASAVSSILHDGMCSETDCKTAGGHVVFGAGPAPMCEASEASLGSVQLDGGQMAVEGSICCAPTKK